MDSSLGLFHPILRPPLRDRLPLHVVWRVGAVVLQCPSVVDHVAGASTGR